MNLAAASAAEPGGEIEIESDTTRNEQSPSFSSSLRPLAFTFKV